MHHFGHSRAARRGDHLLHTPDTFVRIALPEIERGVAIVHASPAGGARFTQYTAELEPSGVLLPARSQRFLYVIEGAAEIVPDPVTDSLPAAQSLRAGSFAYLPHATRAAISANGSARLAVIEKPYIPHPTLPRPEAHVGHVETAPSTALMGDIDLQVRTLLPESQAFDFAVNLMTYQPGASLPMMEVHVMEHGCLMLNGGGVYRLSDQWYPVQEGDFIWMAPYCPQWFGALGKQPASYLIYKDFYRHPLDLPRDGAAL